MIVSPDTYRAQGYSDEEARRASIEAWARALEQRPSEAVLLVGAPAAGKTTWLEQHAAPGVLYYDATLGYRSTRRQLIRMATQAGVSIRAVWLDTPLHVCLQRNAARAGRQTNWCDASTLRSRPSRHANAT